MVEHLVERLTIHHTGVALGADQEAPSRLRAHQAFHQADRGWPDLAYHFSIDQTGNVYEGRSPEFRGDTATSYDPTGHLLVVLEGNFDVEDTDSSDVIVMNCWPGRPANIRSEPMRSSPTATTPAKPPARVTTYTPT